MKFDHQIGLLTTTKAFVCADPQRRANEHGRAGEGILREGICFNDHSAITD